MPFPVSTDASTGSASYLPATSMKSFPLSGAGFTSHQAGVKVRIGQTIKQIFFLLLRFT